MQRVIAILLLVLFCSLAGEPLFAASSGGESNLPACCRRDGKHHCAMGMTRETESSERHISTIGEKCPCCPASAAAIHDQPFSAPPSMVFYAALVSHPSSQVQTRAQARISFDRSRQKRGPPAAAFAS
jgi:hypothetical protein